jgi:hypothetical protein
MRALSLGARDLALFDFIIMRRLHAKCESPLESAELIARAHYHTNRNVSLCRAHLDGSRKTNIKHANERSGCLKLETVFPGNAPNRFSRMLIRGDERRHEGHKHDVIVWPSPLLSF